MPGKSLTKAVIKDFELVSTLQEATSNNNDNSDILTLQEARIRELQKQIKVKDNRQMSKIVMNYNRPE